VRHGDEMTDTPDLHRAPVAAAETPKAESTPAAPAVDMPVAPPSQDEVQAPADAERADGNAYSADLLGSEEQRKLAKATAEFDRSQAEDAAKPYSMPPKKPAPTTRSSKKAVKPAEKGPIANAVSGADPLIEGQADLDLKGGSGGATRGRAADKMQQAAQPPAAPPPTASSSTAATGSAAPGAIDFSKDGDSGGYRVYKQKPMSQAELKASEGKLGVAVKKNDCLTAARIANDILDRNRDYYYKKVAGQTKPCQMAVTAETRNRSARRASKNVGSGKNVAAPAKMKAAPQKDEAAETAE
jgi:hypothetical protein